MNSHFWFDALTATTTTTVIIVVSKAVEKCIFISFFLSQLLVARSSLFYSYTWCFSQHQHPSSSMVEKLKKIICFLFLSLLLVLVVTHSIFDLVFRFSFDAIFSHEMSS